MTGYGKAEISAGEDKYLIEIRSLNGKNCDITLKNSVIPRDKELVVRQYLAEKLFRGNIDLYITIDSNSASTLKKINQESFKYYYQQLSNLQSELNVKEREPLLSAILKIPDVIESRKQELDESEWDKLFSGIKEAAGNLESFRIEEGKVLENDLNKHLNNILSYIEEIEKYEGERIVLTKERLQKRLEELTQEYDKNRLEQEMIYYIEKLDINEEKVRLRQHCKYFAETMEHDEYPGKKLNFIGQELGREINTIGSKANHAEIQKWVVRMKDDLEKIKEQSLNIL